MHRTSHRDLHTALRFVASCDPSAGLHDFSVSMANAIPALIPADVTARESSTSTQAARIGDSRAGPAPTLSSRTVSLAAAMLRY
jgi:hypothetical protein